MDFTAILDAGYIEDDAAKAAIEAATAHMHQTGPYVVLGVYRKGAVTLQFEQNTAAETLGGGLIATITHPAVCVLSGPNGRVACDAADTELILAVASDLS